MNIIIQTLIGLGVMALFVTAIVLIGVISIFTVTSIDKYIKGNRDLKDKIEYYISLFIWGILLLYLCYQIGSSF